MRVLVFAPHNDDEVLGVGGTIAKLAAQGNEVVVCEVTTGLINMEESLKIREEALHAHQVLGVAKSTFLDLPVVALKDTPTVEINRRFLDVVRDIRPEIAFIPHKGDMHIDHAEVVKAAMVALRPIDNPQLKAIYAYETLSETEWNVPTVEYAFLPNCYSDITNYIEKKLQAMQMYQSQIKEFPHPRSNDAIEALAKLRGSTVGVAYAESFMVIREKM